MLRVLNNVADLDIGSRSRRCVRGRSSLYALKGEVKKKFSVGRRWRDGIGELELKFIQPFRLRANRINEIAIRILAGGLFANNFIPGRNARNNERRHGEAIGDVRRNRNNTPCTTRARIGWTIAPDLVAIGGTGKGFSCRLGGKT